MLKRAFMGAGVVAAVLALWVAGPAWAVGGWAVQPVPLPSGGTFGMLLGVSCVPAGDCAAVGMGTSARSSVSQPLAERWDGSSWSVMPVPLPSGSAGGALDGVSCVSAADCVAVGYFGPGAGMPLAERWNGSAWSPQRLPVPPGASGEMDSVSCASADACTAVGSYSSGPGASVALAERWNGRTWTRQSMPAGDGGFSGVSCSSARSCTAIDGGSGAAQWNGASWSNTSAVTPPGGTGTSLTAVSCASAANCTAAGSYDKGNRAEPLAEHWDGATWSAEPVPGPAGAPVSILSSVSCPSATTCTAAGYYAKQVPFHPLAEFWNGTTWRTQVTALPSSHKAFNGISCVAAHACTAVGLAQRPSADFTSLLAEQEP
jgi:hypothetical protein